MNSALCYDTEIKRLYKGYADSKDCVFSEHDKKGHKTYKFSIPGEPIEIVVSSNLHYQGASYLYARIIIKGKYLLNFKDIQALFLLNNCSLDTFQVPAGKWDELFNIIITNYNNLFFISESDIEQYLTKLDSIVLNKNISVFRNKTSQIPAEWEGTFLVMLHAIDKLSNIIKCKNASVLDGNAFFEKRLMTTCRNYLRRFVDCYPTWEKKENDSRLERFSKELFVVYEYIEKHGKPFEFVELITTNNYFEQ